MGVFDKFRKDKPSGYRAQLADALKELFKEEGLDVDQKLIDSLSEQIPQSRLYTCGGKCPKLIWLGDSDPVGCPACGRPLELEGVWRAEDILSKNEFTDHLLAQAHHQKALGFLASNEPARGLPELTRAIELQPGFVDAYHNRSAVRGGMGDIDGSIEDCNTVLRLDPNDSGAYYNRSISRADKGEVTGALDDVTKALSLGYARPVAYFNRAIYLYKLDRTQEASGDVREFIQRAGNDPRVEAERAFLAALNAE